MKEVEEIKNGFVDSIKEMLASPFYGYFLISWLLWNWRIMYSALFVGGEYIFERNNLFKDEYILSLINDSSYMNLLFGPIITVAFFVWIAPIVTHLIYKKVSNDRWKIRGIDDELSKKYISLKNEQIKEEINLSKSEKDLYKIDPQQLWKKEFEVFKINKLFNKFQQIINSVYNNRGWVFNPPGSNQRIIDTDILVFAHSNDLLKFKNEMNNSIDITEKGKYFISQYTNNLNEF